MKKSLIATLLVAGFFGCSDTSDNSKKISGQVLTIAAENGEVYDPVSRIFHQDGKTYWHAGEKTIGVFIPDQDVKDVPLSGECPEGSNFVEFSGTPNKELEDGEFFLYSYFPFELVRYDASQNVTIADIPSVQHPFPDSYDPHAVILTAHPAILVVEEHTPKGLGVAFRYSVAVVNFVFDKSSSALIDEPINYFKITTENNIAGQAHLDLATGELREARAGASQSITALFDHNPQFIPDGQSGIELLFIPTTLAAGSTVIIEAYTANLTISKTITLAKDTEFVAGQTKTIVITSPTIEENNEQKIYHETFNGLVGDNTTTTGQTEMLPMPYLAHPEGIIVSRQAWGDPNPGNDVLQAGNAVVLKGQGQWNPAVINTRFLNLSAPFSVKIIAKAANQDCILGVKANNVTQTQNIVVGSEWVEYTFDFAGAANGAGQSVSIQASSTLFIDDIKIESALGRDDPNSNSVQIIVDRVLEYGIGRNGVEDGVIAISTGSTTTHWFVESSPWIITTPQEGVGSGLVHYIVEPMSSNQTDFREGYIRITDGTTTIQQIRVAQQYY